MKMTMDGNIMTDAEHIPVEIMLSYKYRELTSKNKL